MKRLAPLLTLTIAVLMLTACGSSDPHEAALEDVIDVMSDLESTLAKIEDVDSVEGLGSKFASIGERLNKLAKEMKELEKPSAEKEKELEEKYKPQAEEMEKKIKDQVTRIGELGPEVMMALMKEMQKIEPDEDMPAWMK